MRKIDLFIVVLFTKRRDGNAKYFRMLAAHAATACAFQGQSIAAFSQQAQIKMYPAL